MTAATSNVLEHAIGAEGLFVLRLRDGNATLRAVDGETVRIATDEADDDLERAFVVDRAEGSLSVQARRGFEIRIGRRRSPNGVGDLTIDVPRRASVIVDAASADLSAVELAGDQRYRTVSGQVELRGVSGRLTVDAVSGDIDVVAVGELTARIRTVSGDLAVRAARLLSLDAGTTSGDLRIAGEPSGPGPFSIETVSGDATLALAGGVRIEAATITGDVEADVVHRSEGGRGRRVVVLGDGRVTVAFRSMSGDLRVVPAMPLTEPTRPMPSTERPPVPPEAPAAPDVPGGVDAAASQPSEPDMPTASPDDDARLRILRALERGEIDVVEAGRRLEALDGDDSGMTGR